MHWWLVRSFCRRCSFKHTGDNFFTVRLNGVEVGNLSSTDNLDDLLVRARRQAVREIGSDELVFMDTELQTEGREKSGQWWTTRTRLCGEWRMS